MGYMNPICEVRESTTLARYLRAGNLIQSPNGWARIDQISLFTGDSVRVFVGEGATDYRYDTLVRVLIFGSALDELD